MTHWPGEGEGQNLQGPTGQRGCAGLPAGEGSVLLLQNILLVGRRVAELGGTLRDPGRLAVGDVGEEEVLGLVSSAAQRDALVMYVHMMQYPGGSAGPE